MSTETHPPRRRYEKRKRAANELETRQRILEAALALHGTVGPSRTTISAIAEQAGVRLVRTEMPNADPAFVRVLADVVRRQLAVRRTL